MGISNHHAEARALHAQHTAQPGLIQPLDIASGTGHKHHSQGLGSQCLLTVLCCLGGAGAVQQPGLFLSRKGSAPGLGFTDFYCPRRNLGARHWGSPVSLGHL